jgi:hypothetical protein
MVSHCVRPARTVGGCALFEHRRSIGHPPRSLSEHSERPFEEVLGECHTLLDVGLQMPRTGLPVGGGIANSTGYSA